MYGINIAFYSCGLLRSIVVSREDEMEETFKRVKMIKNKESLNNNLRKMLYKAFGLERFSHIVIVIVFAIICGLLVGYIST